MMPLSSMPAQIVSGDSLALALDASAYPASAGWAAALTLTPMTGGTPLVVAATGGATSWDVAVTSAASAALVAGAYRFLLAATKAGQRSTMAFGEVQVLPDPAGTGDQRSAAARALAAIDAVLEGRASATDLKYVFEDGRSIERIAHGDLIALRNFYARRVAAEKRGRGGPARVQVRL